MNVELIDNMGNDASIVNAARVSFAAEIGEERTLEQDERLIKYLASHNHWTPFAHTAITFRMKAAVPIRTQCFKHKQGFVENEESRRYINVRPEYYTPKFREACKNKKQGSGKPFNKAQQYVEENLYKDHMETSIKRYEDALTRGVCEEQARFYLPQGCVVNWYWTGSLAAYARFYKQRTDKHAQKEIQELALEVGTRLAILYPVAWEELTK